MNKHGYILLYDLKEVILRYYGHSSFQWITFKGDRILIDPFRNPKNGRVWFLREFPSVAVNMVLISHQHFDHDALDRVEGTPRVVDQPGKFFGKGYMVEAIKGRHVNGYGLDFNLIFLLRISDITFCHLGDNRARIEERIERRLQNIDVLMLPIDASHHLLGYDEVDYIINTLEPKIVIPMHYYIPGLTSPESTLGTIEEWLEQRKKILEIQKGEKVLSKEKIPKELEIWYFKDPYPNHVYQS